MTAFQTPLQMLNRQRVALRQLLQSDTTYGSILFIGLCDAIGPDWLEYEAKTVQLELNDEFGIRIDPDVFDRLMAIRTVYTTDLAITSLPSFITTMNALNGDGIDVPAGRPIDPEDLCWGVFEMNLVFPFDEETKLSPEIVGYIEMTLKHFGVVTPPAILSKIMPPTLYNESMAEDLDAMAMISDRTREIQKSVDIRLIQWYKQFDQLVFVNGKKEAVLRAMPKHFNDADELSITGD